MPNFINSIFYQNIDFVRGVVDINDFPITNMYEFAFAGRSNVGKSSLINALFNRSKLARVSNTPGRTREINFFNLDNICMFSDLPGYGYASISKKDRINWDKLIKLYLQGRQNLKRVFLLIDSRLGFKELDFNIMALLDSCAVSYQVILTKADKIKNQEEVSEKVYNESKKFCALHPRILLTSSKTKLGIDDLQKEILRVLNNEL